jgi:hypothetical protein
MPVGNLRVPSRRARERTLSDAFTRAHQWLCTWMSSSTTATDPPQLRILRWVFRRDFDCLTCELRFAGDDCFELCTIPPYPTSINGLERFSQADHALQRQCELEAALIHDGWMLDLHESVLA